MASTVPAAMLPAVEPNPRAPLRMAWLLLRTVPARSEMTSFHWSVVTPMEASQPMIPSNPTTIWSRMSAKPTASCWPAR